RDRNDRMQDAVSATVAALYLPRASIVIGDSTICTSVILEKGKVSTTNLTR
ncbi:hypothetical protein L9F63_007044, partial [Diploptera punctata]